MKHRQGMRGGLLTTALAAVATAGAGAALWLAGCAANEPFDPNSVANSPPTVRFFVEAFDPDGELNPTSYYERVFSWSGSDKDGEVVEYYVSIRTDADVPAAWDSTTVTDTTMSFEPDEDGNANATFYLACRDDRGALSDTVVQFVPMRNFPPAIGFQSDFEPLANMQREVRNPGAADPDTLWWNWGFSNFKMFALDLDGEVTMNDYYRYTLMDGEPDHVWDWTDPGADPETGWVQVPFLTPDEIKEFEINVLGAAPGQRTLTVAVGDIAGSDSRFQYTWEVRPAQGRVIYVFDNSPSAAREFYANLLDDHLGAGQWSTYEFVFGFPDVPWVLTESLRLFELVIWSDGGAVSPSLAAATTAGGPLTQYVMAPRGPGLDAGRLMMVSKAVTGAASGLSPAFRQSVLGVSPTAAPAPTLKEFSGLQALGQQPHLPAMTSISDFGQAIGISLLAGSEAVYRMEECSSPGCFGNRRPAPPYDPIVISRWPAREVEALARVMAVGLQPEYFQADEALAAFGAMLDQELGVAGP